MAVMITRREFVQLSAAALPSLARPLWAQGHSLKLGLQLYTLRQITGEDLPGRFVRLATRKWSSRHAICASGERTAQGHRE